MFSIYEVNIAQIKTDLEIGQLHGFLAYMAGFHGGRERSDELVNWDGHSVKMVVVSKRAGGAGLRGTA